MFKLFSSNFFKKKYNPVFIFGSSRSGTQALLLYFQSASKFAVIDIETNEYWHPRHYPWKTSDQSRAPFWSDPSGFTSKTLKEWTENDTERICRVLYKCYRTHKSKTVVSKSVMTSFMVEHIIEIFPSAKFIHMVRDGRASISSITNREVIKVARRPEVHKKFGIAGDKDSLLKICAMYWRDNIQSVIDLVEKKVLVPDENFIEIKYEDLCADYPAQRDKIQGFLNFKFEPDDTGYFKSANDKWREILSEKQQKMITEIARSQLKSKNYI